VERFLNPAWFRREQTGGSTDGIHSILSGIRLAFDGDDVHSWRTEADYGDPKKKVRAIDVDGRRYHWCANLQEVGDLTVTCQHETGQGALSSSRHSTLTVGID